MVHDWGSRDAAFLKINTEVLTRLPEVVNGAGDYVTVPMQGSGTFAVEAMLTTFVPPAGKVLMLINGAYGHRAKKILDIAKREVVVHETPEDTPPDLGAVERLLKEDATITHIFTVHCETTSGILNPIVALGALAQKYRQELPDRLDERVRRAAARRAGDQAGRDRGLVEQVHRGRAGPRLRDLPARPRWRRPPATPPRWCSTCTTSGAISRRPGSTASRRRST